MDSKSKFHPKDLVRDRRKEEGSDGRSVSAAVLRKVDDKEAALSLLDLATATGRSDASDASSTNSRSSNAIRVDFIGLSVLYWRQGGCFMA